MNKCTIKDIAKLAGVSQATVSSVINNTRHCSAETEIKIRLIMNELNYNPRPYKGRGKHKIKNRSKIGFLVNSTKSDLFKDYRISQLIGATQDILKPKNFELIPLLFSKKEELDKTITSQRIRGLIIFEGDNYHISKNSLCSNCPAVWYSHSKNSLDQLDILTSNPAIYSNWITTEILNRNYSNVCCFLPKNENNIHIYIKLIIQHFFRENAIKSHYFPGNHSDIADFFTQQKHLKYDAIIFLEFADCSIVFSDSEINKFLKHTNNILISCKDIISSKVDIPFKGLHVNYYETGRALARMMLNRLEFPGMYPQVNLIHPAQI